MKVIFTVWSGTREKKTIILVDDEEEHLYENLILKACTKLDINGVKLVLESNGTPIEADVLPFVKSEVLILLQKEEIWMPKSTSITSSATCTTYSSNKAPSIASCSTVTLPSSFDSNIQEESCTEKSSGDIDIKVDCNAEYAWSSFEIPWQKLTTSQTEQLEQRRVDKATITNLIHLTVDEMRNIKQSIPTKAFKVISKKIIDRYPDVFRDIDNDGVVLGDGTHSLVCKLQDRNNYLNRPHKRKSSLGDHNPIASKKKSVNARAGCPNWAPPIQNGNDKKGLSERAKDCKDVDDDFYDILESSYSELRSFLNMPEPPSIAKIKEEWPIICSQKAIYWHFNKLTNSDIHLLDNLGEHLVKIQKVTSYNTSETQENDAVDCSQKALECISSHFKESMGSFFLKCSKQDLSDLIKTDEVPLTPFIVQVGNGSPVFFVYVEKMVISAEGYATFLEALKVAFALFFILNIQYPKSFAVSLELLQRFILKIHPDAGSKCKKVNPTKKRVFNFINRFVKI